MKIRIKGNSLRYRLTKGDIEQFSKKNYIEEAISFAEHTLIYALQRYTGNKLSATFNDNKITLLMPEIMAKQWTSTDIVGFEYRDEALFLLVEKDFKCLDNVAEDQSDNYPNPLARQ
jgi:hypothetical protein